MSYSCFAILICRRARRVDHHGFRARSPEVACRRALAWAETTRPGAAYSDRVLSVTVGGRFVATVELGAATERAFDGFPWRELEACDAA